jgi:pectinesterase
MTVSRLFNFTVGLLLLTANGVQAKPVTIRVPADCPTIQRAVHEVPKNSLVRYKILIAPGTYEESINIAACRTNIVLEADGTTDRTQVVISSGRGNGPLSINADNVTVSNLTLVNTAGFPEGSDEPLEGRALYVSSDQVKFENVAFYGLQDTIFFDTFSLGRSYFYNCFISGAMDFICGGGTAFFDTCTIRNVAKPGYITAPATSPDLSYGFVFWNTTIIRDAEVPDDTCYLMRPWGAAGAAAFIDTAMDVHINTAGWAAWAGNEETCRANELNSVKVDGTPVDMRLRASWVNATYEPTGYFSEAAVLGDWQP